MNQEPQAPLWPEKDERKAAPVGSFGERMQREREMRSISLDEIATSTKIGTRMLHALEAEEFDKLPGGIFNKGFVRAYAKYLGLDEEQAVTDYLAAESEKERRRHPQPNREDAKQGQPQLFAIQGGSRPDNVYNIRADADVIAEPASDQAGGFMMAAVILVFVLGIGGFSWKYFSGRSNTSAEAATTHAAVTQQPPAAAIAVPAPQQNSQSIPLSTQPEAVASVDKQATVSDAKSAGTLAATAIDPTTTLAQNISLDIRAEEASWVQVKADGQAWEGILEKNANKSFHAKKEMVVRLGNAPGVLLSYNGTPMPRFNPDTKTRTLTFTPDGLASR